MIPGRVSVIVPARNERFLLPTLQDLLTKATGDVEVLAVADGSWPPAPFPDDPRLKWLHFGTAVGLRPAVNAAARMATGQYLLKCDAHTLWDQGFDEKLKADYHEDNWILTLRRHALDAEAWALDPSNPKYPIDAHYLSLDGLHGVPWGERRVSRAEVLLDDEMASQGSAWFMSRRHWDWLGELSTQGYGTFTHEFLEMGLKTWLGGGAVKITKRTYYGHLYKGKRYGRGYHLDKAEAQAGAAYCVDFWMHDRWPKAIHSLRWLIEKFAPVPTWPADLDQVFRKAA